MLSSSKDQLLHTRTLRYIYRLHAKPRQKKIVEVSERELGGRTESRWQRTLFTFICDVV